MSTTMFGDTAEDTAGATTLFGDAAESGTSAGPGPSASMTMQSDGTPRIELSGMASTQEPAPAPSLRDTITDAVSRLGSGFAAGSQNLGAGLIGGVAHLGNAVAAPFQLAQDAIQGQPGGTAHRQAADTINTDVRGLAADPESFNFAVGNATPEMVATAGPLGAGANALASGARAVLPQALHRVAPFLGDVSINAGYEAAKATAQGEDAAGAAQRGGAGAAAGHTVGGFLAHGVTPFLNAAQRRLAQAGVDLTPGQMFGKVGEAAEDLWAHLPFTGTDRARRHAMDTYSRARVNEVLSPIGAQTKQLGEDAISHAKRIVSNGYEGVKPFVLVPQRDGFAALKAAQADVGKVPMLDAQQAQHVASYVQQRVLPQLTKGDLDGATWKTIDAELSDASFRYRNSSNPQDKPLGDAYAALRARLQEALQGKVAGAVNDIKKLDTARSQLYVLEDASNKATAKMGRFNPVQESQAAIRAEKEAGDLNRAGRELLTDKRPLSRTLTRMGIPGVSATGAGTVAAAAGASAPVAAAVGVAVPAVAGLSTNILNNPAAVRFILHGLTMSPRIAPNVSQRLATMPPDKAAQLIERMSAVNPSFAQAVGQLGRAYAARQPQGATQ